MRAKEFINETTTAGAIATATHALGSPLTRNSSIYGQTPSKKKKKKSTGKYKNSYNKD